MPATLRGFSMSNPAAQRVLVIDDDADIGQEICESLARKNFEGTYAGDIVQARQTLAGEAGLGIVIVDYHMPGMNGIEVIEALRKETARRLVFIMLTGDDTQSAAINAVRAQAFDFLRKPVNVPTILDAVCRASDHLTQLIEADRKNDAAKLEALALKERVETISDMLRNRETLLERLLWTDRSDLDPQLRHLGNGAAEEKDELSVAEAGADSAPLECNPVDMSALMHRMLPAIQLLSDSKAIQLKARVPNNLPFLYGDQRRLSRAIADLAVVLINCSRQGDRLTIMAVKDSGELVITFRIHPSAPSQEYWRVFTADLTELIDGLDSVKVAEMKLLGTRIVVHLHGGRVSISKSADSETSLRLFFPLPASQIPH
jgi:DNA-binding response OmpR family regulator